MGSTAIAAAITAAITAAASVTTAVISSANMPQMPQDTTNYGLLEQTQDFADVDNEANKAKQEEARKREELRQQQLAGQDIYTSDAGTQALGTKETVLGADTLLQKNKNEQDLSEIGQ